MKFRIISLLALALWGVLHAGAPGISFVDDPELGKPFQVHYYDAGEGGRYHATLVRYPWSHREKPKASILYIHGFNDYFFQWELAQTLDAAGYAFYAIDLHNYGRSYRKGEVLGELRSLTSYFPELDSALQKIRTLENTPLVMLGHSTGGLIATVYGAYRDNASALDAIVLNSPFLDMNMSPLVEALVPLIALVGTVKPDIRIDRAENSSYSESLLKTHRGEWEFNQDLKTFTSLPVDFGWSAAIHAGHALVQRGLKLAPPILVLHSDCSVPAGTDKWVEAYSRCDGVLDVRDIRRYGKGLGKNVKMETIEGGLHDLYLSRKPVREHAYRATIRFLDSLFNK